MLGGSRDNTGMSKAIPISSHERTLRLGQEYWLSQQCKLFVMYQVTLGMFVQRDTRLLLKEKKVIRYFQTLSR